MLGACYAVLGQEQPPVSVRVDLAESQGPYVPIYSWFGYDEPNYTYMQHGRELLTELHDLSPVPVYVRTHNLLTTGDGKADLKWGSTNAYTLDSQGNPTYDWSVIDKIFDAYTAARLRPMVEIGFMPEALSTHPEPYHVQFPADLFRGGWSYPPADYNRWQELVRHLAQHLAERYGKNEVGTWYWEVWNEPDIGYWHGTPEEYFRLYDYAVAGVRSVLPSAKVGGPATTGPHGSKGSKFLEGFLQHCAKETSAATGATVPLDFISFHAKGQLATADGHVRMALQAELSDVSDGFAIVARFPQFSKLPIILSEADPEGCAACSARVHPENAYRNGPLYPCYTAAVMKGMFDLQDRYHMNLAGMLTWAFEFEGRDYFEGFRTLATNGIDKPVLNVFRMAGMMSGNRVRVESTGAVPLDNILQTGVRQNADIDAFATAASREAAIMLWNYHDDDLPASPATVTVNLTGLPLGVSRVLLHHYRIDSNHSNAYSVWNAMGSPQSPTLEQYAQLKAAGQLQLLDSPQWLEVSSGKASLAISLPRQATSLLHLTWQ